MASSTDNDRRKGLWAHGNDQGAASADREWPVLERMLIVNGSSESATAGQTAKASMSVLRALPHPSGRMEWRRRK